MATYNHPIGAPGSVARFLQESSELGRTFPAQWGVFAYAPGGRILTLATFATRPEAEAAAKARDGAVAVDVTSYGCRVSP